MFNYKKTSLAVVCLLIASTGAVKIGNRQGVKEWNPDLSAEAFAIQVDESSEHHHHKHHRRSHKSQSDPICHSAAEECPPRKKLPKGQEEVVYRTGVPLDKDIQDTHTHLKSADPGNKWKISEVQKESIPACDSY